MLIKTNAFLKIRLGSNYYENINEFKIKLNFKHN